jgi:hypothetical protein
MAPADSRPPGCTSRNWPGRGWLSSAPATRHETDIRLCPVPPETTPEPAHSGLANEALAYLQAARPCSAVREMGPNTDLVRLPRTKAKAARASLLSWGQDPKVAIPLTRANRACCAATRTNPLGSWKKGRDGRALVQPKPANAGSPMPGGQGKSDPHAHHGPPDPRYAESLNSS